VIATILPGSAVAVERRDDREPVTLFAAEEAALGRAVDGRRAEFSTARGCAHRALAQLGLPAGPVPAGPRGEPLWPEGAVGSIAHCEGYRAAVVAPAAELLTVGIDAEPHRPLPEGLLADVSRREERDWLQALGATMPATHWDRLLFCAKEAVYKAWYPLAERWLGFEDATLRVDPRQRSFEVKLLVPGPVVGGAEVTGFRGRWLVEDGLVLAAIAVPR
jgi:4'-phosphopantetheinyl transferase EntD